MLTAAWVTAGLSRAKKLPRLDALLARTGEGKLDLHMYLEGVKRHLPSITMEEWRARHSSTRIPQSDSRKGGS
ncbi:hypothetical protein [Paracoccus methylarcula]|uniref:hypothetical protein n=1 Tax=Paracoccus methylarcula TaxID=72022 RepID=UPI0011CE1625|nr:hypothetical protein [Paracoccus methylarcula]